MTTQKTTTAAKTNGKPAASTGGGAKASGAKGKGKPAVKAPKSAKGRSGAGNGKAAVSAGRGAMGGRVGARTFKIEVLLLKAKRPVAVREIETALPEVNAVRNHVQTLYVKRMLKRDDQGRYFVSAEGRKLAETYKRK